MAEETLKYNIEINQDDLASQLEQIRNQIDFTIGSTAFAQDSPPTAGSVVSPAGGFFAAPGVSSQTFVDGAQGVLPTFIDNGQATMTDGIMSNMGAQLDKASEFTQLGFTKFQEDARRIGLLANTGSLSYETGTPLYGQGPGGVGPKGFLKSMLALPFPGLAGFDYDESGMTKTEYKDLATDRIKEAFNPTKNSFFFSTAFAAAGFATSG